MPITRNTPQAPALGELCSRCGDDLARNIKAFHQGPGGGPQCVDMDGCDQRRQVNILENRRPNQSLKMRQAELEGLRGHYA